jgi:GMP synthase-like glutamine amidotransferase
MEDEYPLNPLLYDAFLLTGSRHSVYEELEWIVKLKQFIRNIDPLPVKVIGICFGHQIIAEALGGKGNF